MDAAAAAVLAQKKNQFKCIVPGCRSSTQTNIAKLHSFPWRDMPRAQKWIHAVGSLELLGAPPKALLRLRVCDLHFDKKLKRGKNMKLFDNNAVPTLKLGSVKNIKSKVVKRLPKKKKVNKVKLGKAKQNGTPEPVAETSNNETNGNGSNGSTPTPIRLPRELTRFLSLREKMQKKNTARNGYDTTFSVYALNLYLSTPSAYGALWKSLRLPPPALLSRVDVGVGTRIKTDLIKCFESKMEKIERDEKECVLCIDEVELTKKLFYAIDKDEVIGLEDIGGVLRAAPAARALVVAARAVRGRWTQPLGYFYLADDTDMRDLVAPLRKLIVQIQSGRIECRVLGVVSALGPTFAALAHALGVTVESPFVVDATPTRRRIAFLHDPDQLALTLRDTLIAYDIKYRDAASGAELRATWRDVQALHRTDAARALRLLPELTRACVAPTPRQSLRPQLALAVLSRRVAAHMGACGPPDAKSAGTARLLRLAADCLRSLRAPRPRDLALVTRAADALCSSLCDMRIVAADGTEHDAEVFVRSLQVSLAGALHLLAERPAAERDAPLRLARFGLRPLRGFIERAEGTRGRLAPQEFRARFRRWTMRHLVAPVAAARGRAWRADDLAGLLWKAEDEGLAELTGGMRRALAVGELQHRVDLSRRCDLEHVAGALLRECRRAHGCARFVRWAEEPARAAALVRRMDAAFKKLFEGKVLNAVGSLALAALGAGLACQQPCACFPRDTFCRLFIRFRIRAALQTYNRSLRGVARPGSALWLFR